MPLVRFALLGHVLGYSIQQQLFALVIRTQSFVGSREILRQGVLIVYLSII